ncbi:glycosyltransferase [Rhizobiaceae bacterium n13]|uniref:Glycosyltransferase n=1 Tax=Ferirhizobium litorale TaxID=2927786 RepID=A0AAE3QHG6_9HYPH|nr:glycosyltransferase [Fererhizobium litorale]MDI7862972.1 glycosyltransferase [Fererhizobium litorale]MDI7924045.1 glycosyltransferase [Fererhizobium litorale]
MLNVDTSSLDANYKQKTLPKRYLDSALEIFRFAISPNKSRRRISRLLKRLRTLGFHERALADLCAIVNKTNGYGEGSLAAKGLLHFCMDHSDPKYHPVIERCLSIVQRAAVTSKDKRNFAIMAAEFSYLSGDEGKARKLLARSLSSHFHVDLLLASANLEKDPLTRLSLVNRALASQGLAQIKIGGNDALDLYDRIEIDDSEIRYIDRPELISIIVPAYNSESTILTALKSIQQQSWTNFECIVVDDCSSDCTSDVVEKFASTDPRFRLIKQENNAGAYVARNTGLDRATGQFITCHDADDWSHPSKLEQQVKCLLEDSRLLASVSCQARMLPDLTFTRRGMFGAYMADNFSSLMLRREVFERMGYWDSVRFAADGEFMRRFKAVFGKQTLQNIPKLLSFPRYTSTSLTGGKRFGFNGYFFGARQYYFERLTEHHRKNSDLRYPFPMDKRPFAIPASMGPLRRKSEVERHFDVIIASDFRVDGASIIACIEEIQAHQKAGLRTGLVQIGHYEFDALRGLDPKINTLLDLGLVELLVYGEEVSCDLLLIRYPRVLQDYQAFVPSVEARHIKILINQAPMSDYAAKGELIYDIQKCVANLKRHFGKDASWHPIGPAIRDVLLKHHAGCLNQTDLSDMDWLDIVDLREWRRPSAREVSVRPIIGRHSRDHATKWPTDGEAMRAIYPGGDEFEVRVLGGARSAKKVLGSIPSNWTVYPFGSVAPPEFLRCLDFFVYFTNEASVEPFGRVIIEAMSVGVPVILPFSYQPLFEGAALYAAPEGVQPLIRKLVSDPAFYRSQVEYAFEFVDEKFGYDMHIERVKPFLSRARDGDDFSFGTSRPMSSTPKTVDMDG